MTAFRYTRLVAGTTASGRPLAFDDEVDLDSEEEQDEYNQALIDSGRLLVIPEDQGLAPEQHEETSEETPETQEEPPQEEPPPEETTEEPQEEQQ